MMKKTTPNRAMASGSSRLRPAVSAIRNGPMPNSNPMMTPPSRMTSHKEQLRLMAKSMIPKASAILSRANIAEVSNMGESF